MSVSYILTTKGHDVVTVHLQNTLGEIVKILVERGIGAVVVTGPSREVLGILSERDVVRAIADDGAQALDHVVATHMTSKVILGNGDMSVTEAMEHMTQGRFRHLPIVENGVLCGLVSIGDIVKHRLAEIEGESKALREYITTA